MDSIFPPLWKFTSALRLDKIKRASQGVDIYVLYADAEDNFRRKISSKEGDEKKFLAELDLKHINDTLNEIGSYKSEERELLLRLKNFITNQADSNNTDINYPIIFRSNYAYQFFIDSLFEFNVIDEFGKELEKLQVVAKTILDDEDYRDKVFVFNLSQKKYVEFLNKKFGCNINPDSMSKSRNHIDRVSDHITKNFNPI